MGGQAAEEGEKVVSEGIDDCANATESPPALFGSPLRQTSIVQIFHQAVETPPPSPLMPFADCSIRDSFVKYGDLCSTTYRLEGNSDTFRLLRIGSHVPGVCQLSRRLDALEFAENPQNLSIGEPVRNPISAADTQVYLGIGACYGIRTPPFLEVGGPSPDLENTRGNGWNRSTNF
jgi:hypothetical protein